MKSGRIRRWHFPQRLYILMRNDILSMNPGKAMAQAAHAANQFVDKYGHKSEVKEDWADKTRPFGTTIVLSVNVEELESTIAKADKLGVPCGVVTDQTYPFTTNREIASMIPSSYQTKAAIYKDTGVVVMFRQEVTCGYVFVVEESSNQEELVGSFLLHP